LRRPVSSSDYKSSVVAVKFAMSEKNTVSFLRFEAISTLRWPVKIDE